MADIKTSSGASDAPKASPSADAPAEKEALIQAIELLFFAYRDFVSDPDAILESDGLGRAHHRVIHFVARHPGITVAELLSILRITKQSLHVSCENSSNADLSNKLRAHGIADNATFISPTRASTWSDALRFLNMSVWRARCKMQVPRQRKPGARSFLIS